MRTGTSRNFPKDCKTYSLMLRLGMGLTEVDPVMAETFIGHPKDTGDPPLNVISVGWQDTGSGYVTDTTIALQKGLPNEAVIRADYLQKF